MTAYGEDDNRDPVARAVILFFRDGEEYQLGCAGAVARLSQAFTSYVYHMTHPVWFFTF